MVKFPTSLSLFIALIMIFFAPLAAASETADDGNAVAVSDSPKPKIERDFIDGPFGQVHIRIAKPKAETGLPTLILFHPTPYSSDYFLSFMKEMARDRTVIAIDTPGYGDSDGPASLPLIGDYANSAAAVLDRLGYGTDGTGKVDLLGYHTGGLIAAELAVTRPDMVRKVAMPGLPFFTGDDRKQAYRRNAKPDSIKADGSHLTQQWKFSTGAVALGLPIERGQEHFGDAMQCYPDCWKAYHAVFTYESEKRLAEISQPVLLITNAGSLKVETEAAQKYLKHSKLVHMADVTLGGFDLHTSAIAAVVRGFLD